MTCLKLSVTGSLETGFGHCHSVAGAADGPTGTNAPVLACACTACGSENAPLTRWPGAFVLGSATVSVASPAVLTTVAVVEALYSLATPGVKAPNCTGGPSVSDSVAGTVPPTSPNAVPVA